MMAIVWIIALLMAYGAVVLVLSLFWKGEVGSEMRKSCLVWILLYFGIPIVILIGSLIYNSLK